MVSDVGAMRHDVSGTVRVGMIGTTGRWLVPRLVAQLKERYPRVEVTVAEGTSNTLEPRLVSGQLDLAVVTMPVPGDELSASPLFEEDLVLVVPADHPLAEGPPPRRAAPRRGARRPRAAPAPAGDGPARRDRRRRGPGRGRAATLDRARRGADDRLAHLRRPRAGHPPRLRRPRATCATSSPCSPSRGSPGVGSAWPCAAAACRRPRTRALIDLLYEVIGSPDALPEGLHPAATARTH